MRYPWITYGNTEGPYFTEWRFDELGELAKYLQEHISATGWKIWYNREEDFHILEFTIDSHKYSIEYYKVFTVHRDGDCDKNFPYKLFGHSAWPIVMFFKSGRHITWSDKHGQ